ncbi:MAG: VIT domain-containing protein, partial [Planctomycetota bacterium JB042]
MSPSRLSVRRSALLLAVALSGVGAPVRAAGLLVDARGGEALELVSHRVSVSVDDQVARTAVTQVFRNGADRALEATYLFPLPEGAGVSDFAMWIDGDRRPAVIAERAKAVAVYESIVRKRRDPALLEQIGKTRFRMRVFPVLPRSDVKIELVYDEVLDVSGGVCELRHPLRLDRTASRVRDDLTISVRIRSAVPIGAVESPSHAIDVIRSDDAVVVGMEERGATLDDDFVLRYAPDVRSLSMSVAAQRGADEDGTFLLVLNPGLDDEEEVLEKDVLLVMDVSGSMDGPKIEKAIRAMERFVESLRDGDRFNILAFSSAVRRFRDRMVPVDGEAREAAVKFVRGLRAAGGTAIDAAL